MERLLERHMRLVLAAVLALSVAAPAAAHPGRLDAQGCHTVRKPGGFTYKSGRVAPHGEYHCHRALVGQPIVLDGLEVLGDQGDQDRDEEGGEEAARRQEGRPEQEGLPLY